MDFFPIVQIFICSPAGPARNRNVMCGEHAMRTSRKNHNINFYQRLTHLLFVLQYTHKQQENTNEQFVFNKKYWHRNSGGIACVGGLLHAEAKSHSTSGQDSNHSTGNTCCTCQEVITHQSCMRVSAHAQHLPPTSKKNVQHSHSSAVMRQCDLQVLFLPRLDMAMPVCYN